jgi:hypothetical protein
VRFPMVSLEFFTHVILLAALWPWGRLSLESKGNRWLGLTTLPSSCADCLEIWKPQPPGTLWAGIDLYSHCFTSYKEYPTFYQVLAKPSQRLREITGPRGTYSTKQNSKAKIKLNDIQKFLPRSKHPLSRL